MRICLHDSDTKLKQTGRDAKIRIDDRTYCIRSDESNRLFAMHFNHNPAADEDTYLNDAGQWYDDGSILHDRAFIRVAMCFNHF